MRGTYRAIAKSAAARTNGANSQRNSAGATLRVFFSVQNLRDCDLRVSRDKDKLGEQ
jgi:hypothetical protein